MFLEQIPRRSTKFVLSDYGIDYQKTIGFAEHTAPGDVFPITEHSLLYHAIKVPSRLLTF